MPPRWPGKVSIEGLDEVHLHPNCKSLSYVLKVLSHFLLDWRSTGYNGNRDENGRLNGIYNILI